MYYLIKVHVRGSEFEVAGFLASGPVTMTNVVTIIFGYTLEIVTCSAIRLTENDNFFNGRAAVRVVENEVKRIPAILKEIPANQIADMRRQVHWYLNGCNHFFDPYFLSFQLRKWVCHFQVVSVGLISLLLSILCSFDSCSIFCTSADYRYVLPHRVQCTVFEPFWSEIGYGFQGNHWSVERYLSFQL